MVLGGFIGSDPILSSGQLRKKVVSGEVRYFLAGGGGSGGGFGSAGGFAFPGQGAGAGHDVVTGPGLGGLLSIDRKAAVEYGAGPADGPGSTTFASRLSAS